jgi:hypothetical protein
MNPLRLSLLPSIRANDESGSLQMEREGFVDEAVVLALINGPRHPRSTACPEDLALAADDLDFAGWQLPATPRARTTEIPPQVISAIVRRATPPTLEEPGIGTPHQGTHRWWLAGLAGAFSTMLFSLLLLTLALRPAVTPLSAHSPAVAPPAKPDPARTAAAVEVAPTLTDASPARH